MVFSKKYVPTAIALPLLKTIRVSAAANMTTNKFPIISFGFLPLKANINDATKSAKNITMAVAFTSYETTAAPDKITHFKIF